MFNKILIANRGEIALRILRCCKQMGIQTVAVYSQADKDCMHVGLADEAVCIGPNDPRQSYLNMANILTAANLTGADAIHPGVGFLSENALFAERCEEQGHVFIGPTPEHIGMMGDKVSAKKFAHDYHLPAVPGSDGEITDIDEAKKIAADMGYPVLIKAASGGGGRGMKAVDKPEDLEEAIQLCSSEAAVAFGDERVYMEKYLANPRHIEFQLLCDGKGKALHLGERDCSLQRRHQKIFEEANSPILTPQQREKMGGIICDALSKIKYRGVGTVELLYENGEFYFMEMNTRIQVEHTITEMVYDIDLIHEQIKVAAGVPLGIKQEDLQPRGHAIELRINAEHHQSFIPSPGRISFYHPPGGYGVRVDSHVYQGYHIPPYYDSMIAKLIFFGHSREEALAVARQGLDETIIEGVNTIIPLHEELLRHEDIIKGDYDIRWLENYLKTR